MEWLFDYIGSEDYWTAWMVISFVGVCIGLFAGVTSFDGGNDSEQLARFALLGVIGVPIVGLAWFIIIPLAIVFGVGRVLLRVVKNANLKNLFSKDKV